ncbi:MAG: carbamoyltransferase HypF, partial [Acidobacteriota bacterium]
GACRSEYEDPTSRRFHAQPVACAECGPRTRWSARESDASIFGDVAIAAAGDALAEGRIVAVKGIGGFHLACDATADAAVGELRRRKGRPHKPLAVMVKDLEMARRYADVGAEEAELLSCKERPIVLLGAKPYTDLATQVAPRQATVGLMLPYSPLHELLLSDRPLVMTSGNLSGEPIVKDVAEARRRLGAIADGFLDHDRPIHTVCDDSVVRLVAGEPSFLRRSRGYAPSPLTLPCPAPPLLAVGGELKSVFCLAAGRRAFLSQHLGDVASPDTLGAFERAFVLMRELFGIDPEIVACDLHPGYLSSQWAERFAASEGLALRRVQHHHAHVAALMAEHGLDGDRPMLGFAFDGTGYGADGTVWGVEVLKVDGGGFERVAHLRPVALPGGDRAVRRPARLALAYLHDAGLPWRESLPCVRHVGGQSDAGDALALLRRQLERRLGT